MGVSHHWSKQKIRYFLHFKVYFTASSMQDSFFNFIYLEYPIQPTVALNSKAWVPVHNTFNTELSTYSLIWEIIEFQAFYFSLSRKYIFPLFF